MPDGMPSLEQMQADIAAHQGTQATPGGMPSLEQMQADIQAHASSSGNEFLDAHPNLNKMVKGGLEELPIVAGMAGGVTGGAAGTAVAPGVGTAAGAVTGAAAGAALGSGLKDTLSHYIYGEDKDLIDSAKDAGKEALLMGAGEGAGALLGVGVKAAAATRAGEAVTGALRSGAAKIGEIATGVPAKVIETYAKASDTIKALYQSNDGNIARMADAAKTQFQTDIAQTRQVLGEQIGQVLNEAGAKKTVDVTPLIKRIEDYRSKINAKLNPDQLKEVDELFARVRGSAPLNTETQVGYAAEGEALSGQLGGNIGEEGQTGTYHYPNQSTVGGKLTTDASKIETVLSPEDRIVTLPVGGKGEAKHVTSAQGLNDIVNFLRSQADGAYGQTAMGFQVGKDTAQMAKGAAGLGKDLLHDAVPGIAKANEQLHKLHKIESRMNKNLLIPGKPEAGLIDAGTGASARNAAALEDIGAITGTDLMTPANQLAVAKQFGKTSFTKGNRMASGLKLGIDSANKLGSAVYQPEISAGVAGTLGNSVMHGSQGVNAIKENSP